MITTRKIRDNMSKLSCFFGNHIFLLFISREEKKLGNPWNKYPITIDFTCAVSFYIYSIGRIFCTILKTVENVGEKKYRIFLEVVARINNCFQVKIKGRFIPVDKIYF